MRSRSKSSRRKTLRKESERSSKNGRLVKISSPNRNFKRNAKIIRNSKKKISSVIFLKNHRVKPFKIENSPVEHNNESESPLVNQKIDEYLFLMLDSTKPFNFNIRDLRSEYITIKNLLKAQLRENLRRNRSLVINNSVIIDYLMPLIKFPSMVILPSLLLISLIQVSSPVNALPINLGICIFICKLMKHKFFRLNLMKTQYQHALILTAMFYILVVNFFSILYSTQLLKIDFWAYQVQVFLLIFLSCIILANLGWILYEMIDTFYSWKRYKEDLGWERLRNDYENFRGTKRIEQLQNRFANLNRRQTPKQRFNR